MNWLNQIVDEVIARHPEGEILIESGGSPSGTYHLGHMRELVTCDAILLELRRRGRQAKHIYFVDDLDIFRKVPVNVPAEWDQYLGMPICDVPAPDGSPQSYADYFLKSLVDGCKALNVEVDFVRSHPKYRSGWFVPAIEIVLSNIPKIRTTLEKLSNRTLDENWNPLQFLEDGRLKNRKISSYDTAAKTVTYEGEGGALHTARYDRGEVKMDWRVDWPARWYLLQPGVEPFGREHASGGGSYETGVQLMRQVFKTEPPIPVPYGDINMVGDTKKMSASKGTAISALEAAQIMPAEVVRYFILRAPINTILRFDPAEGIVKLIDEYAALTAKTDRTEFEEQLLNACARGGNSKTVSRVPFSHLVASYQASLKDADKTLQIIQRTEHSQTAEEDADIIRKELQFIDKWLRLRAPEDVKFELVDHIDLANFPQNEREFLKALANKVVAAPKDADGNYFHQSIYDLKDQFGLQPKEVFTPLYKALIGKTSGPRAGWFLSILPRQWLVDRLALRDAQEAEYQAGSSVQSFISEARITDGIRLQVDSRVQANFPEATIGYVVATVPVTLKPEKNDHIAEALEFLRNRGVSAENLTQQPEIAVWRAAFKTFGVKPSDYLSSAEALAKRALRGNPPQVSPLVDTYNAISIKHLVPMGAVDLQKITGDIIVRYGREGEQAELLGMTSPVDVTTNQVVYADDQRVITWLWNHRDAAATAVTADSRQVIFFADSLLGPDLARSAVSELLALLERMGVEVTAHGLVGKIGA